VLFIPGFNVRQPSRKRTIFDVWCSDPFCNEWNWTRRTERNLNLIMDNIIQNSRLASPRRMDMTEKYGRSFAGKIALVTGGSRGIGEGIVRRLASDGAAVAFTYFNSQEKAKRLASEIDAAGGKAL
jgi:3-oxoacyl-ACP reductase-like protein